MNKELIKNSATLKGYGVSSETDDRITFYNSEKVVIVTNSLITTLAAGKKGYNFVSESTVDAVAKSLLR